LQNRLDEALREPDGDLQRGAIEAAAAEATELLEVFSALLRIAEVEGMAARAHFQTVDLSTVVTDMAEAYRPSMEASGHEVVTDIALGVTMPGDRRLLQQMITNLLDNAISFSPPGGLVRIEATQLRGRVLVRVIDEGPGVQPSEREAIFRRFHSARPEGGAFGQHSGLGLAIARTIVEGHHGTITVADRDDGAQGAVFEICLPAKDQQELPISPA
jgi:signal transduction histidine kinase